MENLARRPRERFGVPLPASIPLSWDYSGGARGTQGCARATAGRILKTIMSKEYGDRARSIAGPVLDDVVSKRASRIWKLINVRNAVVHGQKPASAILEASSAAAMLLSDMRRHAGWG